MVEVAAFPMGKFRSLWTLYYSHSKAGRSVINVISLLVKFVPDNKHRTFIDNNEN